MKSKAFTLIALAAGTAILAPTFVAAQEYPTRPITLVVNFGAGGTTDLSARLLAEKLTGELGVPVVVENRGGGSGSTGLASVTNSAADGYTIGTITASPITTLPYTQDMGFDAIEDLTYLAQYATTHHPVIVSAESEWESLDDLLTYARENPGQLRYSTAGTLNQAHLAAEQLAQAENVQFNFIPYSEGGAAAMTSLIGGHIDAVVVSDFFAPLEAGQIRLLAETGEAKIAGFEEVPTFAELGYDFGSVAVVGIVAPAGLDPETAAILNDAIGKVAQDEQFQADLQRLNMVPFYRGAEDFAAYAASVYEATGEILETLAANQ